MKIKQILTYTACLASVLFIGSVCIDSKEKRLERLSGRVVEGDLSVLGDTNYYYKDYGKTEDVLLSINKDGITIKEQNFKNRNLDNINSSSAYPNNGYENKLRISETNLIENKTFFEYLEQYEDHNLYFLLDENIAIHRNANGDNLLLDIIINEEGNTKKDSIEIPFKDFKIEGSLGVTDYYIKAADKNESKLQIFIATVHSFHESEHTLENMSFIYVEKDLKTDQIKIKNFNELMDISVNTDAIINNNKLYLSLNGYPLKIMEFDLIKNFEKIIITEDLIIDVEDDARKNILEYKQGSNKIGNTFYYLNLSKDGSINLNYFDAATGEVKEYRDIKAFMPQEVILEDKVYKNSFNLTQVFIENGKLFIEYDYQKFIFDRETFVKVIDLESGENKLTLEIKNATGRDGKKLGKIIG
ncbi:MAG: hypothetical protein ACRCTZ_03495 [Sarcina sp.]